jgi:hypothetical protein
MRRGIGEQSGEKLSVVEKFMEQPQVGGALARVGVAELPGQVPEKVLLRILQGDGEAIVQGR